METEYNFAKGLSLSAFQKSAGVPLEAQIRLVNNPLLGEKFHRLDVSNPKKWELPIGCLRNWVHERRLIARDGNLSVASLKEGEVIYISNSDGRIESSHKIQLAANYLYQEIQGHVIVLGKTDIELNDRLLQPYEGARVKIFGNNLNTNNSLAGFFPMGRDFRGKSCHTCEPSADKNKLVYCNFSLNTHPCRGKLWSAIKNLSFVYSDHMGEYQKYSLTHRQFYDQLASSKFCVAPRGNAIETFRMWDSLYVGTIPIVVKEAVFHDELQDLPILFVNSVEDIACLDEAWLERKYTEFLEREWNYEKLRMKYWLHRVEVAAQKLLSDYPSYV